MDRSIGRTITVDPVDEAGDSSVAIEATVSFIDPAAASPSIIVIKPANYRVVEDFLLKA